ncbi:cation-translocating P-type ATPase [Actinomadura rudentiformis]|uniref:cation-translocating P-type ATPase n=1 Tax=Actinomadura rudentiformis TaxID=359158 RepID=UPI00178C1F63|nr:cation-translocating P-type ATPase [Actinomadura rudentiformis]
MPKIPGVPRLPGVPHLADLPVRADLGNLLGPRTRRRVWSRNGRAYIELRGRSQHTDELRRALASAVRHLKGVRWAEVNAVTGELLCAFDEGGVTIERLIDTIESVEEAHDIPDETFPMDAHPADQAPITAEAIALASDCAAFALATTGKFVRLPKLPRGARLALTWMDNQPRLREQLETRIGPHGTDLVLAAGNAAMHGLTQEPAALAVDAVNRVIQLSELTTRRATWCDFEEELCSAGLPVEAPQRQERPCPLPDGPIETCGDRAAMGALAGAGAVLALTRVPATAADVALAMVPRAARLGRAGFAATLDREFSRRGVVALDGSGYRRLDRVSAVIIDSPVLCQDSLEILEADGPEVWRAATRLLGSDPGLTGEPDADGRRFKRVKGKGRTPPGGTRLRVVEEDGTALGEVLVGPGLDPLAEALPSAVRDSGARVLLTEHASTAEFAPLVDDVLGAGVPLSEHVRELQRDDGHGVLVVTTCDDDAALAADVGIGVRRPGERACWGADLICTGGLDQVWRLLSAVGAAHEASRRSVRLAVGGSSLGTLLVVTGRRATSPLDLAPVHSAAVMAMVGGVVSARRLAARRPPDPLPRVPWHALDPEQAAERAFRLRPDEDAVPRKRTRHPSRPVRAVTEVAQAVGHELRDPLTPVLVLGAAASAVVGSGVDAALVGGVMTGNALISGVQRARAEHVLRGLLLGQRAPARRVRRGEGEEGTAPELQAQQGWAPYDSIPAAELRLGDVIAIGPSDVVPADARLLAVDDLEVDEATLTGESQPVTKTLEAVPGADLAERSCMLYEDTTVLAGRAYAVVVATGAATQAGRAAALAGRGAAPSGVQAQLNELTRVSLPVTGISGALVSALSLLRGVPVRQAVESGVAVAVAAVPEGLPLVATVAQLAAARRLTRRNVLVRSSRTLGTMGRVDTLCFDKTGTLTEGRLRVTRISSATSADEAGDRLARRLLTAALRACPQPENGDVRHATDRAVLEAAESKLGEDSQWELLHETPFEPSRGYAAATGRAKGKPYVAVKGAPEVVLPRCDQILSGNTVRSMTGERRDQAHAVERRLASRGLRVLAVAEARPSEDELADGEKLGETFDLVLVGFLGIADTPRADAGEAISTLSEAGIRVAMITGDHPDTAQAVAADLGIPDPGNVLTGAELDRLSDRERSARITETAVFARVSPEHKVRIVQALQKAGRTVAMTGDGANDAAAIRLADVGIGLTAGDSRAAQSAADLILRGGDLPGIVAALMEGRTLWESVRNAVSILVGGNAGEIAFTVYGTALGGRAPLTTRQLLLVNTLTDMMPALAVALAPPNGDGYGERPARGGPLGDPMNEAIAVRGVVTAVGAILAWQGGRFTGRRARAGTMGLAALVMTQLAQTLQTGWRSPAVLATCAASVLVLAAVIETPGVSRFFGCVPLGPIAWSQVIVSAGAAMGVSAFAPQAIERLDAWWTARSEA